MWTMGDLERLDVAGWTPGDFQRMADLASMLKDDDIQNHIVAGRLDEAVAGMNRKGDPETGKTKFDDLSRKGDPETGKTKFDDLSRKGDPESGKVMWTMGDLERLGIADIAGRNQDFGRTADLISSLQDEEIRGHIVAGRFEEAAGAMNRKGDPETGKTKFDDLSRKGDPETGKTKFDDLSRKGDPETGKTKFDDLSRKGDPETGKTKFDDLSRKGDPETGKTKFDDLSRKGDPETGKTKFDDLSRKGDPETGKTKFDDLSRKGDPETGKTKFDDLSRKGDPESGKVMWTMADVERVADFAGARDWSAGDLKKAENVLRMDGFQRLAEIGGFQRLITQSPSFYQAMSDGNAKTFLAQSGIGE
jgi:hypothetical protein